MSHIVKIETEVRDPAAITSACTRMRLPAPVFGKTQLYQSSAVGWAVQLPDWNYPVVCDVSTARLSYDNFAGRWGDQKHLDLFLQSYAIEKAKIEARKNGHSVTEQPLNNGSVKLTVSIGGAV